MKRDTPLRILAAVVVFLIVVPIEWFFCHMPFWDIFLVFLTEEWRAGKNTASGRQKGRDE
jgi:hypothetical protein